MYLQLEAGLALSIVVGQSGDNEMKTNTGKTDVTAAGGGGGSFVYETATNHLLAAAGGGGGANKRVAGGFKDGQKDTSGGDGTMFGVWDRESCVGGKNGNAGQHPTDQQMCVGGVGAGWLSTGSLNKPYARQGGSGGSRNEVSMSYNQLMLYKK